VIDTTNDDDFGKARVDSREPPSRGPAEHNTPRLLGIVNLTADSFSDGGLYLVPEQALAHIRALRASGADIIDLGPASSHPDGVRVAPAEEIRRLEAVLAGLADAAGRDIAVSIDSYQPEVQLYALQQAPRPVQFLNDINGFAHPHIYPVIAAADCRCIVMFSIQRTGQADRGQSDPAEILDRISEFFEERLSALTAAGIARERLILDPGMGFFLGTAPQSSLNALRGVPVLKARFGLPVLVSVSRKSFLGALTGRSVGERGAATLAAELYAAQAGADYIRTHDVQALRDGLAIVEALEAPPPGC
jgi:dihydropteroate synthase type 2